MCDSAAISKQSVRRLLRPSSTPSASAAGCVGAAYVVVAASLCCCYALCWHTRALRACCATCAYMRRAAAYNIERACAAAHLRRQLLPHAAYRTEGRTDDAEGWRRWRWMVCANGVNGGWWRGGCVFQMLSPVISGLSLIVSNRATRVWVLLLQVQIIQLELVVDSPISQY